MKHIGWFFMIFFLIPAVVAVPMVAPSSGFIIEGNRISVSDTVVHDTGYYSSDGSSWSSFVLSGNNNVGNWIIGGASADVDLSDVQYVVIYSCSWKNSWDCHGNGWQRRVNSNNPGLSGNGLLGEYYDSYDFSGIPKKRIDQVIDFDWTDDYTIEPFPGMRESFRDRFAVRWTGQVSPGQTGLHTFYVDTHNGVRFWFENEMKIDEWNNYRHQESFNASLEKGKRYIIKMEYYQNGGPAEARLSWKLPDGVSEVIPQKYLFGNDSVDFEPSVSITSPDDGLYITSGKTINIDASASDDNGVTKVDFYVNGILLDSDTTEPFSSSWNSNLEGEYDIVAIATDTIGTTKRSAPIKIFVSDNTRKKGEVMWSDPATWGGSLPQTGDLVYIGKDQNITLDVSPPNLKGLKINGKLSFARKDLSLSADHIMVMEGGELNIGSEENPFNNKATITLTGTRDYLPGMHCGVKVLCSMGGKLELHGTVRGPTWTRLVSTAKVGDNRIVLEDSVDWLPGDEIVVVSTDYDPGLAEKRKITYVNGNEVGLNESLRFMHYGEIQFFGPGNEYKLDERAEVIHLTRNIVIQGDDNSIDESFGGHVMAMNEHHVEQMARLSNGDEYVDLWKEYVNDPDLVPHISGVEFRRLGQTGILARYPWHWHLYGDASGSYVKDSSVHQSFQRCYTIHGTQNVLLENNVAFDVIGHCYFLEDGAEWGNTLRNNVGALVKSFPKEEWHLIKTDVQPAVFYWSNPRNWLLGNVAAGGFGLGFHFFPKEHPDGPSTTEQLSPNIVMPGDWYGVEDNVVHSVATIDRQAGFSEPGRYPGSGMGVLIGGDRVDTPGISCVRSSETWIKRGRKDKCQFVNLTAYYNERYGAWFENGRELVEAIDSTFADNTMDYWNIIVGVRNNMYVDRSDNIGNPGESGKGFVEHDIGSDTDQFREFEKKVGRSIPWYNIGEHRQGAYQPAGVDLNTETIRNALLIPQYDGMYLKDSVVINYNDDKYFDTGIMNWNDIGMSAAASGIILINSTEPYLPWKVQNVEFAQHGRQTVVRDLDGSLTGSGEYREIRESKAPYGTDPKTFFDETCQSVPGDNRYMICSGYSARLNGDGIDMLYLDGTNSQIPYGGKSPSLPVNKTYRYSSSLGDNPFFITGGIPYSSWIVVKIPAESAYSIDSFQINQDHDTEGVDIVNSETELYSGSNLITMYYDSANNIQYMKMRGTAEALDLFENYDNPLMLKPEAVYSFRLQK